MGVVNLEEIVEQLGINNRTFQIHFKNQVGISPKLFCRIIRFNSLLFALDSSPTADILSFAIQFGYTDKPHLYKDFKQFLGMTPKEYKRRINNVNALVEKEVKKYFPE
ncbi:helix-turn-helix domain-containing protein [Cognataquiflexum rubidum]|uniref:helix-turn-helix domain-containing protein n=1 Tax=Cognataquiflexum rubidum TaxID=2922273 RepID=UPI001F12E9E3|nr:helix-turn-helix domain-containing protein [Cognataquiflexum rubidum]